jgi:23S rRNA (adenine2503-C2)-methyltransferase
MNATVLHLTPSEASPEVPQATPRLDVRPDLKAMTRAELGEWVVSALGEPRFRGDQIFRWIHLRGVRDFAAMSDLARGLRERLTAEARLGGLELEDVKVARDGTRKLLLRTAQGDRIESVLIPMDDRITQCVSSQVGCKIGCDFCLTARMPLRRHLSASEIVDQVLWARRVLGEAGVDGLPAARVSNLVYMGMGEPLDNYDNMLKSLRIISDEMGMHISTRRITVSTSGVVPKLERLAKEDIQPNLAISLNASNDAQRDRVIPINKAWNIARLLETLRAFPLPPRRLITIEYVMLAGFNDSLDDAKRLATLLRGLRCKVNLIPFNPWPGANYDRPTPAAVDAFGRYLLSRSYTVTVRYSKGDDIGAACGQLDGKQEQAAAAAL